MLAPLLVAAQIAAPAADLDRLAWMAGCWIQTRPDGAVEEHWMAPAGGLMLGMARTVRAGQARDFEFTRIAVVDGALVFVAQPSGQAQASFPLKQIDDAAVVFENLDHDFPQRVIYRRQGPDAITGRIEGLRNGQTRGVDFPYRRCARD